MLYKCNTTAHSSSRTTKRISVLLLLCFLVAELSVVPFLGGCTRSNNSGMVVFHRKIRKDTLAETVKAQVNASDLPSHTKAQVNKNIDDVPEANSDQEQISLLVAQLADSLKSMDVPPEQTAKVTLAAAIKMSEQNEDQAAGGLLPVLQRPEVAAAVQLLIQEGLPQKQILQAVLEQVEPSLVATPQGVAAILSNSLFADFTPAAKTAVLAASGDPESQRQVTYVAIAASIIEKQGFTAATATALKTSLANLRPAASAAAQVEAIIAALAESAVKQGIGPEARIALTLDAVDGLASLSTHDDPVNVISLQQSALMGLKESGVAEKTLVTAFFGHLQGDARDTAAEVDALLASPVFANISPSAMAQAKQDVYAAYVPAPVMSDIAARSITEDLVQSDIAFTISDGDSILSCTDSVTATSSNTTLLPASGISLAGTAPKCSVSLSPADNQSGTSTVTLTASDGTQRAQKGFLITVTAANDAPTLAGTGDTNTMVSENTTTPIALATGTDPDTATDGQTLGYFVLAAPVNGTLGSLPANAVLGGNLNYTPNNGYTGSDSLSYQICDSFSPPVCSSAVTVTLTVLNVNEAPTDITLSSSSVAENSSANAMVGTLGSTDADTSDTFTYSLVAGAGDTDNGAFSISGDALRLTASPDFETKNSYTVRIQSRDTGGSGLTFSKAIVITITNVNETPSISALADALVPMNTSTGAMPFTIADPDSMLNCATSVSKSSSNTSVQPESGIAITGTAPNCYVTLTPASGQTGQLTATLTVSDGSLSAAASMTFFVGVPTEIVHQTFGAEGQRRTFFDATTNNHWSFSYREAAGVHILVAEKSANGTTWSHVAILTGARADFTVTARNGLVYLVDSDGATVRVRRGNLGSSSLSLGSPHTVFSAVADEAYGYPAALLDSSG